MPYHLPNLSLSEMTQLGVKLRATGQDGQSVEEIAERVVTRLHNEFVAPDSGVRACVLVRFVDDGQQVLSGC